MPASDGSSTDESFYGRCKKKMRGSATRGGRRVANCCASTWPRILDALSEFWSWILENVCCCFQEEVSDLGSPKVKPTAKSQSKQAPIRVSSSEKISEKTVRPQKPVSKDVHPPEQKEAAQLVQKAKETAQKVDLSKPPKMNAPEHTAVSQIGSTPQLAPIKSSIISKEAAGQHANQVHQPVPQQPKVEPPKIDFVETGSLFGDRKRLGAANLLLLENGRFKSPGQPLTTQGPGGRTIRMSFRTGFPSMRSLESRASLKVPIGQRSTESVKTIGSNESKLTKQSSKQQDNEHKSKKSIKSYFSKGSREMPLDSNEPHESEETSEENPET